jgi:hypothetical protein
MAAILFPFGVRLSTWGCAAAFTALALRRWDWRPIAAAVAWMWGFEIAFQVASIAEGHHDTTVAARFGWILIGVPVVAFLTAWVRPDRRLFSAAVLCFGAWIVIGFHVNDHTTVGFDPYAEASNELAKTMWAVAYLVPLLGAASAARASVSGTPRTLRIRGRHGESASPLR